MAQAPTAGQGTMPSSAAVSPAERGDRRVAHSARLLGGATAGVVELFGFHPVDTVAKRLMAHDAVVRTPGMTFSAALSGYSRVALRDAYGHPSLFARYASLFPGLSFAAAYKILQRVYKFGGQPVATDFMTTRFGAYADALTGCDAAKSKLLLHASAGAMIGVGEVVLLPLDVLKIKSQNNPAALAGRGLISILRQEKLSGLYKGAGWTAARNAPGSFSLFGASAFVKGSIFGLENFNDATLLQNFAASAAGGIASITVASPLDVVKTRLQMRDFGSSATGFQILKDMMRKEGPGALFKGLVPKLFVVGPKLIFSFTIAQHTIALFDDMLNGNSRRRAQS
jgi:Mitochondrial carrier protein